MPIQQYSQPSSGKPRVGLHTELLACLAKNGAGVRASEYQKGETIFCQATTADAVFCIQQGTVILRVVSSWGKEGIVAILGAGDFFGEGCLTNQPYRTSTAVAMTDCSIVRIEKSTAMRLIRDVPAVSELFLRFLLSRNLKMEEDLVDQLFNTSEKRLARLLLQLARFDGEGQAEAVIPKINQETLAEIVGTTRSRVSLFMNKFRRLGLVDYIDHTDVLKVRSQLLNVMLQDGVAQTQDFVAHRPAARMDYCPGSQLSM